MENGGWGLAREKSVGLIKDLHNIREKRESYPEVKV